MRPDPKDYPAMTEQLQTQNAIVNPPGTAGWNGEEVMTEEDRMRMQLQMQEMKATLQLMDLLLGNDGFNALQNAVGDKENDGTVGKVSPPKRNSNLGGELWNPFVPAPHEQTGEELLKATQKRRPKRVWNELHERWEKATK